MKRNGWYYNLSVRAANILNNCNIRTMPQLKRAIHSGLLLRCRNCGVVTMKEFYAAADMEYPKAPRPTLKYYRRLYQCMRGRFSTAQKRADQLERDLKRVSDELRTLKEKTKGYNEMIPFTACTEERLTTALETLAKHWLRPKAVFVAEDGVSDATLANMQKGKLFRNVPVSFVRELRPGTFLFIHPDGSRAFQSDLLIDHL